MKRRTIFFAILSGALLELAGCALLPLGTELERDKLKAAGDVYKKPFEEREIADLPLHPLWSDVLQRAFLVNGELEAAYFEWQAAFARIGIASSYPNSNLSLGYSYMFSRERIKSFDRMSFFAGFDSMENLSAIPKVLKAGEIAFDEAKSAAEKFRAAKFALQEKVLTAWSDYALAIERERIQKDGLALAKLVKEISGSRVEAGGSQYDLLKADLSYEQLENELKSSTAAVTALKATLNGLLVREPSTPLEPPTELPGQRSICDDDSALLAVGVENNAELAASTEQSKGSEQSLELARLQWIPDINPTLAFTGAISQSIGAAFVLPTNVSEIRGRIREADAIFKGSQAALRQARADKNAEFVATLIAMRNSERQSRLLETKIIPSAKRIFESADQGYRAGTVSFLDLLESERVVLDTQLMLAEARTSREKELARLETLAGVDFETISPTAQPVEVKEGGHE